MGEGRGGEWNGLWQITQSGYSRHQIPSDTLNYLSPCNTFLPSKYYFLHIFQPAKSSLKSRINLRNRSIWVPVLGRKKFLPFSLFLFYLLPPPLFEWTLLTGQPYCVIWNFQLSFSIGSVNTTFCKWERKYTEPIVWDLLIKWPLFIYYGAKCILKIFWITLDLGHRLTPFYYSTVFKSRCDKRNKRRRRKEKEEKLLP